MVPMLTNMFPQCLGRCPALCELAPLAGQIAGSPNEEDIKKHICEKRGVLVCVLQPSNLADCQSMISMAASYHMPQTETELSRRCGVHERDYEPKEPSSAVAFDGAKMTVLLMLMCTLHLIA